MPKLRISFLNLLQEIGDRSGCHQIPERSFKIKGYTFPVCARCTGVFVGQSSVIILLLSGFKCPPVIAIALVLLMGLDWFIQKVGIKESTNLRRLITGVCGGFGLFSIYVYIFTLAYKLIANII